MNSFSPTNPLRRWSRRDFLEKSGNGLGAAALAWLLAGEDRSAHAAPTPPPQRPRAKQVIQLFMNGGASQCDTFDYKPELIRRHGERVDFGIKASATSVPGPLMKSPWEWRQHGQCGRWVSNLFPHMARGVDDMAFLMAMTSITSEHSAGLNMQTSGFVAPGFPSAGAWVSYALGTSNRNLPAFIALPDPVGLPWTGKGAWTNGFLPASHQGIMLNPSAENPAPDLFPPKSESFLTERAERDGLDLLLRLNRQHQAAAGHDDQLEARIASYELAARMQLAVPDMLDLRGESEAVRRLYGLDQAHTAGFGRNCLIARRLIERGVRFVQVWSGSGLNGASGNWDNHENIGPSSDLEKMARASDQPAAALLRDLKSRGMLDETLVIWTTEFGRTPFNQDGNKGRDHNGHTFVSWMAGGGVKGGVAYGESDPFSYQAAVDKTYCYDQHATILHLLGVDHEKLVFRHNGADRRLTDVHGHVLHPILS